MSLLKNSLFLIFQYLKCHFILNQQARPISMDKESVEKFTKYKSKYATWNSANPENFSITIVFKATMTRDVESCQPFMAYCPCTNGYYLLAYFDSLRVELNSTIWGRILPTISIPIQNTNSVFKQRKKMEKKNIFKN